MEGRNNSTIASIVNKTVEQVRAKVKNERKKVYKYKVQNVTYFGLVIQDDGQTLLRWNPDMVEMTN